MYLDLNIFFFCVQVSYQFELSEYIMAPVAQWVKRWPSCFQHYFKGFQQIWWHRTCFKAYLYQARGQYLMSWQPFASICLSLECHFTVVPNLVVFIFPASATSPHLVLFMFSPVYNQFLEFAFCKHVYICPSSYYSATYMSGSSIFSPAQIEYQPKKKKKKQLCPWHPSLSLLDPTLVWHHKF